jgi:hypothetical protein
MEMTPGDDAVERHRPPDEDELSKAGTAGDQPNDPDADNETGLYNAVHDELLAMRKHRDGVTVGNLARTTAILEVLGAGDPRLAYNQLKHVLLSLDQDLAVTAAGYSLGYASDYDSHLGRLDDFGRDYTYDQRQARRYSDKGIEQIARHISSEWVLEASPTLSIEVVKANDEVLELVMKTERLAIVEMREPIVELVQPNGAREVYPVGWNEVPSEDGRERTMGHVCIDRDDYSRTAVSILWTGEAWPQVQSTVRPKAIESSGVTLRVLAARAVVGFAD